MKIKKFYLSVLITMMLLLSIFSVSAPFLSEGEQSDLNRTILVYKENSENRDEELNFLWEESKYDVLEEYDSYILVETSQTGIEYLEDREHNLEELENEDYVGLQSHSFYTEEGEPEIPEELKIEEYSEEEEGYYILQFRGPIKSEWREELEGKGVTFHEFRHRFNFIVEMDRETKRDIEKFDFVNWVGIYQPAYRFYQELLEEDGKQLLAVSVFDCKDVDEIKRKIRGLGGEIKQVAMNRIEFEVETEKIENIANLQGVNSIVPATEGYRIFNHDATWITQTNEEYNRKITEEGITGEGELITVMDSELYGGSSDHDDHEMWEDPDGNEVGDDHRKIQEHYVPDTADGDLNDGIYHGTHVVGTALGDSDSYSEYSDQDGNALDARLIFQDVDHDSNDDFVYPPSDMYEYGWAPSYNSESRVHSNSFGGGEGYTGDAISGDEFIWEHKDFNILYAMGNEGPGEETLSAQPEGKNIFSIGGVVNHPDQESVADFSSRGYADDGRIKPTLLHVGQWVDSASRSEEDYEGKSGTSMSTPGVAGQAGQVRQYYEEGWHVDGTPNPDEGFNPSNALVRATLINSAVEITGDGAYYNDERFPNNDQGFGRSKLDRTLHFEGNKRNQIAYDSWDEDYGFVDSGESWNMTFSVDDPDEELEITLAWTDPPGEAGADESNPAIVNDLDLEVEAPDGTKYVGNAFTSHDPGYSEPDPEDNYWSGLRDGEYDGLNVEENVLLLPEKNDIQTGTYEVTVNAHQINEAEQPFALVVSGGLTEEEKTGPMQPMYPQPEHEGSGVSRDPNLSVYVDHYEEGEIEKVTFYNASDVSTIGTDPEISSGERAEVTWDDLNYGTEYEWYAVAEDEAGDEAESDTWTFTTEGKAEPSYPKDGASNVEREIELNVTLNHEEGERDVTFLNTTEDEEYIIGKEEDVGPGKDAEIAWEGLEPETTYEWYVIVSDENDSYESDVWTFTTEDSGYMLALNVEEGGEVKTHWGENEPLDVPKGNFTFEIDEDEPVDLEANSDYLFEFEKWEGDYPEGEQENEDIEISMDEDKEITAYFEEMDSHKLTLDIEGEGGIRLWDEWFWTDEDHDWPLEIYILKDDIVDLEAHGYEGWVFERWESDYPENEQENKDIEFEMDEDKEITARFEEAKTLEVDIPEDNEGMVQVEDNEYSPGNLPKVFEFNPGETVSLYADPALGWEFVEWYDEIEEETYSEEPMISLEMIQDKELTAHFDREEYVLTIQIEGKGEELNYGQGEHPIESGEDIELIAYPEEGWEFVEWTGKEYSTEKEVNFEMPAEDTVMTAHFEEDIYELEIIIDGGGSERNYGEGTHDLKYEQDVELDAEPDDNWEFIGWTGFEDSNKEVMSFDMPDEDITMTAHFESEDYTLTIEIEGEGKEVNYGESHHNLDYGEDVELEASSAEGWDFIEWTGFEDSPDKIVSFEMPNEDVTMTAHFEKGEYTLSIAIDGEGEEVNYGEGQHPVKYDENIELKASSNDGWEFIEWSGYETFGEKVVSFNMPAEDITMTAHFKELFDLTISYDEDEGTVYMNDDSVEPVYSDEFRDGTNIHLEAEPEFGYEFDQWEINEERTTENPIDITIDEDKDVEAIFEDIPTYELTVHIDGEGEVEISPDQDEYEEGTNVNLNAYPADDYVFEEWTGDETGTDPSITVTMDDYKEITAHFVREAFFEVEITDYDREVYEGESVRIDYQVFNSGNLEDTQEIEISVNGISESHNIYLDPGSYEYASFTWSTRLGDAGEYELVVASEDDEDEVEITVIDPSDFQVEILDFEEGLEIEEGEKVTVEFRVENQGHDRGIQEIEFKVDGEVEDSEVLELSVGQSKNGEFTWDSGEGDAGFLGIREVELEIASDDDREQVSVYVEGTSYSFPILLLIISLFVFGICWAGLEKRNWLSIPMGISLGGIFASLVLLPWSIMIDSTSWANHINLIIRIATLVTFAIFLYLIRFKLHNLLSVVTQAILPEVPTPTPYQPFAEDKERSYEERTPEASNPESYGVPSGEKPKAEGVENEQSRSELPAPQEVDEGYQDEDQYEESEEEYLPYGSEEGSEIKKYDSREIEEESSSPYIYHFTLSLTGGISILSFLLLSHIDFVIRGEYFQIFMESFFEAPYLLPLPSIILLLTYFIIGALIAANAVKYLKNLWEKISRSEENLQRLKDRAEAYIREDGKSVPE